MSLAETLEANLRERTRQRLDQVQVLLPELVKAPLNQITGQLAAGIVCDAWQDNGTRYDTTIRSLAPYSQFVDEGTGIYGPTGNRIYPTSAKALVFFWYRMGDWFAFRSVRGSPAQHFFHEAMPDRYDAALQAVFG